MTCRFYSDCHGLFNHERKLMTILFEKDFIENGRPKVILDTSTTNISFLKMSRILQLLGIKNHKFMLTLYDEKLLGVDPYKLDEVTDPTGEMRKRVAIEAKLNYWYYLRELARISVSGTDPVPFILNRANLATSWLFFNHIDTILVQPRQTGKTILASAIMAYVYGISGRNLSIGSLVHESQLLQSNVQTLKNIVSNLPPYMYFKSARDTDNKEGLRYDALNNRYLPRIGSKEKAAARKIGRGGTIPIWHFDEFSYISNIEITYSVVINSTSQAIELAKKYEQPYGNLITTTAGDPNTVSGKFALDMLNDAMKFNEKLYDCKDYEDLKEFILSNSNNNIAPMVNCTFNYRQLGYSDEWFAERVERAKSTPDEIARDFLCVWKTTSSNPIIDKQLMHEIERHRQVEPNYVEQVDSYLINWYIDRNMVEEYRHKSFVVGMDTSDLIGRDYTTFVAIDPYNLAVICTFRCNVSVITQIGLFVFNFLNRFRKAVWIPERKSSGAAIIDIVMSGMLKNGMNPFRRIFNYIVQEKAFDQYSGIDIDDYEDLAKSTYRSKVGFMTTGKSRNYLFKNILTSSASISFDKIRDTTIINELSGLTKTDEGRIDHKTGHHDDTVIAWLLACFLIIEGKNLNYYGLKTSEVLRGIDVTTGKKFDADKMERQKALRDEMNDLANRLKSAKNEIIKEAIIQKLTALQKRIDPEYVSSSPYSVDLLEKNYREYQSMDVNQYKRKPKMKLPFMGANPFLRR